MVLYQEIGNNMPNPKTTLTTDVDIVSLKEVKIVENALFDVEDDPQNIQVRMK